MQMKEILAHWQMGEIVESPLEDYQALCKLVTGAKAVEVQEALSVTLDILRRVIVPVTKQQDAIRWEATCFTQKLLMLGAQLSYEDCYQFTIGATADSYQWVWIAFERMLEEGSLFLSSHVVTRLQSAFRDARVDFKRRGGVNQLRSLRRKLSDCQLELAKQIAALAAEARSELASLEQVSPQIDIAKYRKEFLVFQLKDGFTSYFHQLREQIAVTQSDLAPLETMSRQLMRLPIAIDRFS